MSALDRLRTIAEQATPGPWERRRLYGTHGQLTNNAVHSEGHGIVALLGEGAEADADARYLEALDPPTVLALLDVAEAAAPLVNHVGKSQDGEWDAAEERLSDALDRLREVSS